MKTRVLTLFLTVLLLVLCAACALGACAKFQARTPGEGDEWKLFQRKGGKA